MNKEYKSLQRKVSRKNGQDLFKYKRSVEIIMQPNSSARAQAPSIPLRAQGAQGTIEYLVIIAVVVVIALVVVSLLVGMTGQSSGVSQTSSQIAAMTAPIAIVDSESTLDGNIFLSFKNNTGETITLTEILIGDESLPITNQTITQGANTNIVVNSSNECEAGGSILANVTVKYMTATGLTKTQKLEGVQITCSDFNANEGVQTNTQEESISPSSTDTQNPALTLTSPSDNTTTIQATWDLNFGVTDNNMVKDCNLSIDSTPGQTLAIVSNNYTGAFLAKTFVGYTAHTWSVTCTDYNNNSITQTFNLTLNPPPQEHSVYLSTNSDFNLGIFNQTMLGSIRPIGELDWNASTRGNQFGANSIFWNDAIGVWHANGNANDSKDTNNMTFGGTATYAPGINGENAASFNGSSMFSIAKPLIPTTSNNYTISLWIKTPTNNTTGYLYGQFGGDGFYQNHGLLFTSGQIIMQEYYGTLYQKIANVNYYDGQWHHIVATRSDATTAAIYFDGQPLTTTGTMGTYNGPTPNRCGFGADTLGGSYVYGYSGLMDEMALFNRALLPAEVQQLYLQQKGTWQDQNLVAYYKFNEKNGTTIFDSANGLNGTLTSGADTSAQGLWDTNALNLNGSNYANVPHSPAFDIGTGDFTLDAWIFPTDSTRQNIIMGKSPANSTGWLFLQSGSDLQFLSGPSCCSWTINWSDSTAGLKLNAWNHVAITQNAGQLYFYVNGIQKGTRAGGMIYSTSANLLLGGSTWLTSSLSFNGRIEEAKIYTRGLLATEVQADYNRGLFSGGYTSKIIDTSAISTSYNSLTLNTNNGIDKNGHIYGTQIEPAIEKDLNSGLWGLWHLNETSGTTFTDSSGRGNNLSCSTCPTTTSGLWNTNAQIFGSSNKAAYKTGVSTGFEGSFTFSAWVNAASFAGPAANNTIMSLYLNGNDNYRASFIISESSKTVMWGMFDTVNAPNVSLPMKENTWYHLVGVRDTVSDKLKLYSNGVLYAETTDTTGPYAYQSFYLGKLASSGYGSFNGKIEEAAVWTRALDANEVKELFNKGAARIGIKYRSCPDATCSTGPAWTPAADYNYSHQNYFDTSGLSSNEYFQWAIRPTLYPFPDGNYYPNAFATLRDVNIVYTN